MTHRICNTKYELQHYGNTAVHYRCSCGKSILIPLKHTDLKPYIGYDRIRRNFFH